MLNFVHVVLCCLCIGVSAINFSSILFPDENGQFHIAGLDTTLSPKQDFERYASDVNSLSNINDFAAYFNVGLPRRDPFLSNITVATRFGAPVVINADEPVRDLDHAICLPEMTTVPLNLPEEKGVTYFPTCVRVERCGGCCFLSHHSCQPVDTEKLMVKVMKMGEEVVASSGRRRRVRNAEPNYISVEVARHNKCDCKCRLQASDCTTAIQNYNEFQCACVCKNKDEELKCLGSRNHYWNNDSCQCLCRTERPCSTGQVFNHESCRCM